MQVSIVSKTGLEVLAAPDWSSVIEVEGVVSFKYAPNGKRLAFLNESSIRVISTDFLRLQDGEEQKSILESAHLCDIDCTKALYYDFSPLGNFVVTWERGNEFNLRVWNASTGAVVKSFSQKQLSSLSWPLVQWDEEEIVCGRLVKEGIEFFNGSSVDRGVLHKLSVSKALLFSFCPRAAPGPLKVAAYLKETANSPASVRLYEYPSLKLVCSRSFHRSDWATFHWHPKGESLLIHTATERDKTGKSYYGESNLFFMKVDGSKDMRVPFDGPGAVHSVDWNSLGTHFVVVQGSMPPSATLFTSDVTPVFTFGARPINHTKWSPNGKLLALVGLGGMNGDIEIWEMRKSTYCRKVGTHPVNHAHTLDWAPTGLSFMTSICFPRLRVDNQFAIWTPQCDHVYGQSDKNEMTQVVFRPFSPKDVKLEEIPNYPPIIISKSAGVAATKEAVVTEEPKKSVYLPPHLRNKGIVGGTNALNKETEVKARRIPNVVYAGDAPPNKTSTPDSPYSHRTQQQQQQQQQQRVVPGMAPTPTTASTSTTTEGDGKMSKTAARNKRRREARRNAQKTSEEGSVTPDVAEEKEEEEIEEEFVPMPEPQAEVALKKIPASSISAFEEHYPSPNHNIEAEIRKLRKKLRQLDMLKQKRSRGEVLTSEQVQKLNTEKEINLELESLAKDQ